MSDGMTWTTTPPTEPGQAWWYKSAGCNPCVGVTEHDEPLLVFVSDRRIEDVLVLNRVVGARWARIPEPRTDDE